MSIQSKFWEDVCGLKIHIVACLPLSAKLQRVSSDTATPATQNQILVQRCEPEPKITSKHNVAELSLCAMLPLLIH